MAVMRADKEFGVDSPLATSLPGFEPRPEQARMAEAVDMVLEEGGFLMVEAGTGVGKSLAYLLPALKRAFGEGRTLMLSTATLTLQDQLLARDIPTALRALGIPAEKAAEGVVRAMGRGNYFCRLRFELLQGPQSGELFSPDTPSSIGKLGDWASREAQPVRERLTFDLEPGLWDRSNVDAYGCPGTACPHARDCFFLKERERLRRSKVAVVNHAMLLSDVAARRDGSALLPDMDHLVVDEAHHLERMASEHLGIRVGALELDQALNPLVDARTGRGLAARMGFPGSLMEQVQSARSAALVLFEEAAAHLVRKGNTSSAEWQPLHDGVSGWLLEAAATVKKAALELGVEGLGVEAKASASRLEKVADALRAWTGQSEKNHVYWMEPRARRSGVTLRSAPLKAGEALSRDLYPRFRSLVFTSATLATHKGLDFSRGRLGIPAAPDSTELVLGSPFDTFKQVELHLESSVTDPRYGEAAFNDSLEAALKKALSRTDGRAFVLFTSFRCLEEMAGRLKEWVGSRGWLFLEQGGRSSREKLLERFRGSGRAVLFGAASFWEGVDVPGEALSSVVITRLPFAVPDTPLEKARAREVEEAGGNAFADLSLPEAVLRLKQGFGRLLRHSQDRGSVTLLDARVLGSSYGRLFLKALPRCRVFIDGEEQEAYN